MKRGKEPPDLILVSDTHPNILILKMIGYLLGKTPRVSVQEKPEVQNPQLCTIMRAMLDELPKRLDKGKVRELQEKVLRLAELSLAEQVAQGEQLHMLEGMLQFGDIDRDSFQRWKATCLNAVEFHHREMVGLVVELYSAIRRAYPPKLADSLKRTSLEHFDEVLRQDFSKFLAVDIDIDGEGNPPLDMNQGISMLRDAIRQASERGYFKPLRSTRKFYPTSRF